MPKRLLAMALAVAIFGGWASSADAAFVSKRAARVYLLRAVPAAAPRVLLRDRRSAFFHTARLRVEPARRCRRRGALAVSCQFWARLVPDAAHRRRNWWPIHCRGAVLVRRLRDGRLHGLQRDYVCRTVRLSGEHERPPARAARARNESRYVTGGGRQPAPHILASGRLIGVGVEGWSTWASYLLSARRTI